VRRACETIDAAAHYVDPFCSQFYDFLFIYIGLSHYLPYITVHEHLPLLSTNPFLSPQWTTINVICFTYLRFKVL
jgi:hypothetical protein